MQRARIKGTDLDLGRWERGREGGSYEDYICGTGPRGLSIYVPKDWVEFYDPPREEPLVRGSVEVGNNGTIYVRTSDMALQPWSWVGINSGQGYVSWTYMQNVNGPTKPMKVVE